MAYLLDSTTIKSPNSFKREQIEIGVEHTSIDGETRKSITKRKERFILTYENLTQSDASTIISIWNQEETVDFESTETNNTISATSVHVDIKNRDYRHRGTSYLESFDLILTEVV